MNKTVTLREFLLLVLGGALWLSFTLSFPSYGLVGVLFPVLTTAYILWHRSKHGSPMSTVDKSRNLHSVEVVAILLFVLAQVALPMALNISSDTWQMNLAFIVVVGYIAFRQFPRKERNR